MATSTHDPEALEVEADQHREQQRRRQAEADAARTQINEARHAAERAYWKSHIEAFYPTERDRPAAAWNAVKAALETGDTTESVALWLEYRRVLAQAQRRHRILADKGHRYAIPGMRPKLIPPGPATYAEAVDAATRSVTAAAAGKAEAALEAGAVEAADAAEEATRRGKRPADPDATRVPLARFKSPSSPTLILHSPKVNIRFHDGEAAAYETDELEALRKSAARGDIIELTD